MYDVITFGSATEDVYLKSKKFFPIPCKNLTGGRGICFNLGSKIEVENAFLFSGGGGTNTAVTFTKQGFKVAYCGAVGDDFLGNSLVKELEGEKIDVSLVKRIKGKLTNISLILAYPGKDRTILLYRGASDNLRKDDISWNKIKETKWIYLAPFSGELVGLTEYLVNFAKKNNIKIALNPGYNQLTLPKKTLEKILRKIDVLILNQEEASLLTGIPYKMEKEIFKKIDGLTEGICIMTKGKDGVVVSDGKYLYYADSLGKKAIDSTGAGDSFGAGFVSGIIKTKDIVSAVQFGIANSVSNIKKFGAKEGLLNINKSFPKIKVKKEIK